MDPAWPWWSGELRLQGGVAIRWLKRLGFRFIRKHEQYGPGKQPFLEFVMTEKDLAGRLTMRQRKPPERINEPV